MKEQAFDLTVIGGGPGGYVAAIRGAQLGLKTALVEKEHLGGICLNWGCIPTKALLRSAEVFRNMKQADAFGLKISGAGADITQIVKRSRSVSEKLRSGVGFLMAKNKVTVFNGHGRIDGPGRVKVDQDGEQALLKSPHIIIATGARPLQLKDMEADGKIIWTYKEAMTPEALPEKLLIVGAGAIGVEFASFYNEMGVAVTLVEALPQVLPGADDEISAHLRQQLEKQGIKIHTGSFLRAIEKKDNTAVATLETDGAKTKLGADRILLALGVVGNTENLGFDKTNVKVARGIIQVDEWLQTGESGIYAIGDVTGPPCLAHKASHEGVICVEKIAGLAGVHPLDRSTIPYCTYAHPQVASIGMTEKQAAEARLDIKVGRFPFGGNGKAIALGETEGMVKTIFNAQTGELLGAHMIGAEVTEMIQGYGIAMNLETTEAELMHIIFAHPTLSEMMHESVLAAYGRAVHI